ncbi:hypothetical protein GCM10027447_12470 [Glycomyces halotolerans]
MPVTLAQAQLNTQDDVTFAVIDNLRRYSWLLDQIAFDDTVNPTGGDTLVYGYTRLKTPRTAAFRKYNEEYTPAQAETERVTVELKPLGGSFGIDRVLARLGQAATNQEAIQLQQLLTAIRGRFQEELINGDTAVDADGFDGLDTILTGTETELTASGGMTDLTPTAITSENAAMDALDELDEWLSTLVPSTVGGGDLGEPGALPLGQKAILGNTRSIMRMKAVIRRAGLFTEGKDDVGRNVMRYGDWALVDIGDYTDGSGPIIPITTGSTDLYAVTFGMDALHGASVAGTELVQTWMPDYTTAGAVKDGEAEMGPCALVVENTKACGVIRGVGV